MVPRFNCRHDGGMLEEEGGQYVDAEDYDALCNFLIDCFPKLIKLADSITDAAADIEHVALNGV